MANFYAFARTRGLETQTLPSTNSGQPEFVLTKEFFFMSRTGPSIEIGTQFTDFILETLEPEGGGLPIIAWSGLHDEDEASCELYCYYNWGRPALIWRGLGNLSDAEHRFFNDTIFKLYRETWADFEIDDSEEYENCFPEIGEFKRERDRKRNRKEREPHVLLRTLSDQRRATPTQQLYTFLYATAPEPIFREVLAFV
mmetsp:Transcript_34826/g.107782  ORF Transcript_34826/g.107782 Transcript_34826/m.107782 type:complete len:198 (-) Transcript_34826:65-658(-)